MTQTRAEKLERLARRSRGNYRGGLKGETAPGSMNDRKPAPVGSGRRSRDRIKADSRKATA